MKLINLDNIYQVKGTIPYGKHFRVNGNNDRLVYFFCVSCDCYHVIDKSIWTLKDESSDQPTVVGSVLSHDGSGVATCHCFIEKGILIYDPIYNPKVKLSNMILES